MHPDVIQAIARDRVTHLRDQAAAARRAGESRRGDKDDRRPSGPRGRRPGGRRK